MGVGDTADGPRHQQRIRRDGLCLERIEPSSCRHCNISGTGSRHSDRSLRASRIHHTEASPYSLHVGNRCVTCCRGIRDGSPLCFGKRPESTVGIAGLWRLSTTNPWLAVALAVSASTGENCAVLRTLGAFAVSQNRALTVGIVAPVIGQSVAGGRLHIDRGLCPRVPHGPMNPLRLIEGR